MSAQTPTQISGTSSTSPLLQRLRGTLSAGSQQILSLGTPTKSPTSAPSDAPLDVVAQAVPLAVDQMADTLNPPVAGGGTAKEAPLINITVEHPAIDQVPGLQYVETEKSHELPPEVEGFLQKVEDNVDQIPQEIVLSDLQSGQTLPRVMAQPVIILPITAKMEEEGKKKSSSFSLRWLVELSWKLMKIFTGKIIYRQEQNVSKL